MVYSKIEAVTMPLCCHKQTSFFGPGSHHSASRHQPTGRGNNLRQLSLLHKKAPDHQSGAFSLLRVLFYKTAKYCMLKTEVEASCLTYNEEFP